MPKRKPPRPVVISEAERNALLKLADDLEALNRGPFKKMLALLLGVKPTAAALQKFANKAPDRWAQSLSVLGTLAGYERGAEVNLNVYTVHGLSDAELLKEAGIRGVRIIDGEATEVGGGESPLPPKALGVVEKDGVFLPNAGGTSLPASGPTPAAEAASTDAPQKPRNPLPL